MSTETLPTLTHANVCGSELQSCCRENHLAAIALNEVGSKLYASGKQDEAIEMFDAAAQVVVSQTPPCPTLTKRLHWGCQRIQIPGNGVAQFQQHPPDTYLEGECDVGPRPLRQPIHLDASSCPEGDAFIVSTMILFNRALVHHSKSELDEAMENYSQALAVLTNNTSVAGRSRATLNRVAHLAMMLHNNMGQISYIDDDEENAVLHFEASVFWAQQISAHVQEREYKIMFATVLSNYCRSQWIQGNTDDETFQAFKTVLELRMSSLPDNHEDVACAHYNLGIMAFAKHMDEEAKTHLREYLTIAKKKDSDNLDKVPAMTLLLLIENRNKQDKLSVELNRALHALQEKREEFGATHMEVASLLNYVGTLLFHRKELRAAILFYREELRLEKTLMSDEAGISICVTYNNIGRILQELGELPEAIGCYRNALKADISDSSYAQAAAFAAGAIEVPVAVGDGTNSPSTTNLFSTIWYNLGLIHDKLGARREAIMSFQMALGLRRKILGVDHPDIACLWYNIGTLQMEISRLDDAAASFQEALRIRRLGKLPEDPKHILTTLKKLASLQQTRGNIDDALTTLTEILQIQESSAFDLQWKTPNAVGQTLSRIADLQEAKGDLSAALAFAERSYLAFKSSGAFMQYDALDHVKAVEEVARSLLMLGSLLNESCEPIKAQAVHEEARLIVGNELHRLGGVPHPALQPLLDASTLQSSARCAPVA